MTNKFIENLPSIRLQTGNRKVRDEIPLLNEFKS
jgi:hypothetical protein